MYILDPEAPNWYVVYSKTHKEDLAKDSLALKGLNVFLPRLLFPQSLKKRRRIVPLFPSYLFVRFRVSREYHHVIWCPGVKRVVSFCNMPAPVDERVIEFLMQQATSDGIITGSSNLKVGGEVQIRGGPFDGLIGILQDPPNGGKRVKVLMKLLSREVKVEVPVEFVEAKWTVGAFGVGRET